MDEFDIHNRKRNLERAVQGIEKSKEISAENKKLILDFHNDLFSRGLSIDRVLFYLSKLSMAARWLKKDFADTTEEDIKDIVRKVELNRNYSEWTKCNYKLAIKIFYKWLEGSEEGYPNKVRWIKVTVKKNREKLTNLPTIEDVKKLIEGASTLRDKALISVLYESGCRIGEVLNLRVKDVEFDDYGAVILVNGKTGARRTRLVTSVPHLANWIENGPDKNPEAPVWINNGTTNHRKLMKYQNVRMLLREIAAKAGIDKPVNPHIFRKARATHLASNLTEAQMCEYFGWTQGSDMPSTYVHLSGRDLDNAILRMHGRLSKEERCDEVLKTKKCPRCDVDNPPEANICKKCGLPLDIKTAVEMVKRRKDIWRGFRRSFTI